MFSDSLISELDRGLRAIVGVTQASRPIPVPATSAISAAPTTTEPTGAGHASGAGATAASDAADDGLSPQERRHVAGLMRVNHLAWTAHRLAELGSRPSLLNPLWYAGAFAIGFVAGKCGDNVSLGFMSETERQVEHHLDTHLDELPPHDLRSRAIVDQMRLDEIEHGQAARDAGGIELPVPVQRVMRAAAKVMTTTAYYI
jgi:ubiquinone biosynthesis monooxygenase Coq7